MSKKPQSKARATGPVLIEMDDAAQVGPAGAAPVPDLPVRTPAMQTAALIAARKPSRLGRLFFAAFATLIGLIASVSLWDFVTSLLTRNVALGYIAAGLGGVLALALIVLALREWLGFLRLKRLDQLRASAALALANADLPAARKVAAQLDTLYTGRPEAAWGLDRFRARQTEQFDADALLTLAEAELLAPLDASATREVESAARIVATVTAFVPLAFADIIVALSANLRMIRRIAEIYGGRAGMLGSWRLARAVLAHLVATGAVAVGDDLIGSLAGGGLLSKLSRRFGEGVINGALTARVGVAAMEVCRPLPFHSTKRPGVSGLVKRALTGLFAQS